MVDEHRAIKDQVKELSPDYFHYKDIDNLVDPYEGEILRMALESLFFYGPEAIGSKYPTFSFADEWAVGFFKKGTLNATTQHSVWLCHFNGLKNVSLVAPDRLAETYNGWVEDAYNTSQAQAKFSKKCYVQTVVHPQDVHPDTPTCSLSPHDKASLFLAADGCSLRSIHPSPLFSPSIQPVFIRTLLMMNDK
ncbi:hypothetical protein RSAG8_12980, partial [Rhizoctonia solani AG-8 WAC10335]